MASIPLRYANIPNTQLRYSRKDTRNESLVITTLRLALQLIFPLTLNACRLRQGYFILYRRRHEVLTEDCSSGPRILQST